MFLLTLVWVILYVKSPYLFPLIGSALYFLNWNPSGLALLLAFPYELHWVIRDLSKGHSPSTRNTFRIELFRWILMLFVWELSESTRLWTYFDFTQKGYCYAITLAVLSHMSFRLKIIRNFWMIWLGWMIVTSIWDPRGLFIGLIFHLLNFGLMFRIFDFSTRVNKENEAPELKKAEGYNSKTEK